MSSHFPGLVVPDDFLITRGLARFPITAMVDLGATHTIANPAACEALGVSISDVPVLPLECTGIDGRSQPMRRLALDTCAVTRKELSGLGIFAADIHGLVQIGECYESSVTPHMACCLPAVNP